jgi:hypothetical protein
VSTIRFLIFNTGNLELIPFHEVARVDLER